ncbi:type IV secretion system protein VirB7 [Aminobacter sp. MSH1]|uniref:type IV secretion system protein VirB7 n=1 Tax=Aminobacter sp. MSH1 TaxID=374606 RepID=UPI001FDEA9EC|nr:type IV secretion system protein VirB7 [Aminobacter sp. MSH1]
MKRAITALIVAASLAGCASTQTASIPALDGAPRVPVNKVVPDTVPYTVPTTPVTPVEIETTTTTTNTPGE